MNARKAHKRLLAAHKLLLESGSPRTKFNAIRTLIKGFRPELDRALEQVEHELSTVDKMLDGNITELAIEHLPEDTEEQKKRKKAALFFIQHWHKLEEEVGRVEKELAAAQASGTKGEGQSHWMNILKGAAGPLGVITVLAVGLAMLKATEVAMTIENRGCGTMAVSSAVPLKLPGLSLPTEPIKNGGSATAKVPPLTVAIDGTSKSVLTIKALALSMTFELPSSIRTVTLDGSSLLGKKSSASLGDSKTHTLVLTCGG